MNPVIAEVSRGAIVESVHTGAWVVADPEGSIVAAGGDVERPVFPRSAVKAFQALPLLVSGAADAAGFTAAELALACASHDGSPAHVEAAAAMLRKVGRDAAVLECGVHWPSSPEAAHALAAAGQVPNALHNNCSGKHAGFVAAALHRGLDPAGYVNPEHGLMREVTAALAGVTGAVLSEANRALDGCSIPTFAIPLRALATGFARFGTGHHMPGDFAEAATRLRRAVAAHPLMVGGAGKFDSEIAAGLGEAAFVKIGAEGVHAGAFPGLGLGFAIKSDDGAARACEVACAALLLALLGGSALLERLAAPRLRNRRGVEVGRVRGLIEWPGKARR